MPFLFLHPTSYWCHRRRRPRPNCQVFLSQRPGSLWRKIIQKVQKNFPCLRFSNLLFLWEGGGRKEEKEFGAGFFFGTQRSLFRMCVGSGRFFLWGTKIKLPPHELHFASPWNREEEISSRNPPLQPKRQEEISGCDLYCARSQAWLFPLLFSNLHTHLTPLHSFSPMLEEKEKKDILSVS